MQVPPEVVEWKDFLESRPPGTVRCVENAMYYTQWSGEYGYAVALPDLRLHCDGDACSGSRFFGGATLNRNFFPAEGFTGIIEYNCKNCQKNCKHYAVSIHSIDGKTIAVKIGEWRPFGSPTPAQVITLIGEDRELFLQGRRCENQGLGVGAFAYYRRVVENQKDRLLDQIIKVAVKTGASPDVVKGLEDAKKETQFSKAIDGVRPALPESIKIDGHNPLLLLHGALSEGLHAQTDEDCLEAATTIRLLLTRLAERMAELLKDENELRGALKRLLGKTQK